MGAITITQFYHYRESEGDFFGGHVHQGYEINIVLEGELEVTAGDNVFILSAGNMLILDCVEFHRNKVINANGAEFISLHFSSNSSFFGLPRLYNLSESDLSLVYALKEDALTKEKQLLASANLLLEALLLRLSPEQIAKEKPLSRNAEIYRSAVIVMKNNISSPLTVYRLSKMCGVCATTLKNAFLECTGGGVMSYFTKIKLSAATEKLCSGMNVGEVSESLGFSSPSYFCQWYKKSYGYPPKSARHK